MPNRRIYVDTNWSKASISLFKGCLTTCVVNEVAVSKDELLKSEVDSKRRTSCYYLIPNQLTHSK